MGGIGWKIKTPRNSAIWCHIGEREIDSDIDEFDEGLDDIALEKLLQN